MGDQVFVSHVTYYLGVQWVADAALFDHALQCRHFLGAAAEADTGHTDLRLRIFVNPYFGLLAKLVVCRFYTLLERMSVPSIQQRFRFAQRPILGEGAFDVIAGYVFDALPVQQTNLIINLCDGAPVLRLVIEPAVAGAVQRGDVQALVRVVGMQQHRYTHPVQIRLSLPVSVQVVLVGGVGIYAAKSFSYSAHGRSSLMSVGLTENLDQVIPEIAMSISRFL